MTTLAQAQKKAQRQFEQVAGGKKKKRKSYKKIRVGGKSFEARKGYYQKGLKPKHPSRIKTGGRVKRGVGLAIL